MKPKARIAAIIVQDGKLLMLHGKGYTELWTPGGKADGEETDEECLKRELKEEIGVNLLEAKFFKEYQTYSFYHSKRAMLERVYIAKIEGDIKPNAEIESIVWLSKEDFEKMKYPMITHIEKELIPDLVLGKVW